MDKFLIFHASAVDSSSVTAHDSGTNVDLGCFNASDISAIMGEEDMVYIYFRNAGRFEEVLATSGDGEAIETMEQTFVRLTVAEGKEIDVIKQLTTVIGNAPRSSILFDAVNSSYPITNVTAIQIRRHLTTHTIASD